MSVTKPAAQLARREIPLRGYVIILTGTVIWALTGIVIKILLTQYGMNTLTIAFWRVFFVSTFLLLVLILFNPRALRISPHDLPIFMFYGLIGVAIHQFVWITSVQWNGAAVATVIVYTSPALVAFFAWRFLHEKMDQTRIAALVLTTLGCALVARVYDATQIRLNAIGLLAGIGSAFTFASYSLFGRVTARRYSAWTALFYAFAFGMLFLTPVGLFTGEYVPQTLPLDGWGALLFLALIPTLGGFASYTIGLTHLPASVASILAAFEPVTTAIIAFFLFGEVLDAPQLLGAGLILWGVIMLRPRESGRHVD